MPIRTCICCRDRFEQKDLLRLQTNDENIVCYTGLGRSFYLCADCIEHKEKIVIKKLLKMSVKKDKDLILSKLEEILINAKS
jgi:predicted RNA-binding protein YlxR (DUF448 family)